MLLASAFRLFISALQFWSNVNRDQICLNLQTQSFSYPKTSYGICGLYFGIFLYTKVQIFTTKMATITVMLSVL